MTYEVDMCCDCAVPGYPCLGNSCSRRHVLRWKCEYCGADDLSSCDMYDDDMCKECHEREEE